MKVENVSLKPVSSFNTSYILRFEATVDEFPMSGVVENVDVRPVHDAFSLRVRFDNKAIRKSLKYKEIRLSVLTAILKESEGSDMFGGFSVGVSLETKASLGKQHSSDK